MPPVMAEPKSCPKGKKLKSGYCVKTNCRSDYVCPAGTERKPNRNCYSNKRDCRCQAGYTRNLGGKCVLRFGCRVGLNWFGKCPTVSQKSKTLLRHSDQ
jgi:hypothetical protein